MFSPVVTKSGSRRTRDSAPERQAIRETPVPGVPVSSYEGRRTVPADVKSHDPVNRYPAPNDVSPPHVRHPITIAPPSQRQLSSQLSRTASHAWHATRLSGDSVPTSVPTPGNPPQTPPKVVVTRSSSSILQVDRSDSYYSHRTSESRSRDKSELPDSGEALNGRAVTETSLTLPPSALLHSTDNVLNTKSSNKSLSTRSTNVTRDKSESPDPGVAFNGTAVTGASPTLPPSALLHPTNNILSTKSSSKSLSARTMNATRPLPPKPPVTKTPRSDGDSESSSSITNPDMTPSTSEICHSTVSQTRPGGPHSPGMIPPGQKPPSSPCGQIEYNSTLPSPSVPGTTSATPVGEEPSTTGAIPARKIPSSDGIIDTQPSPVALPTPGALRREDSNQSVRTAQIKSEQSDLQERRGNVTINIFSCFCNKVRRVIISISTIVAHCSLFSSRPIIHKKVMRLGIAHLLAVLCTWARPSTERDTIRAMMG